MWRGPKGRTRPSPRRRANGTGRARPVPFARRLGDGRVRPFGPRHVHQVTNDDLVPAVSVHVYAPSLREMTEYERRGGLLYSSRTELAGVNW